MIRPDVVQYLRDNLPNHPVEMLRRQLLEEGVTDIDFEHCLADALRSPKATLPPNKKKPASKASKLALMAGLVLIVGVVIFTISEKTSAPAPEPQSAPGPSGESGYVGTDGWVVRLPKDYAGVSEFKDSSKTDEIIHFAKRGTDPTNFLDEGLYGQMGIVRLEVARSQFPANPTGAAALAQAVKKKTESHGEKYVMKTIQIGMLPGVQVNVQAPFPRVEAYILGQSNLYFFSGGEEDEIWRDIVLSLRDAHSEQ
jgi:hypothetical protein